MMRHTICRLTSLISPAGANRSRRSGSSRPTTAQEALTRILVLLGGDRAAIPQEASLRTELFQAMLARRRVLLVLDNAADEAQVRPLLPWGTGSAVLVTGRRP